LNLAAARFAWKKCGIVGWSFTIINNLVDVDNVDLKRSPAA